jgi:hypothetical protein
MININSMKKHSPQNLLKNLMYVAFGLVFAIGISYIHADTYTDNSNPPTNNTPTPLSVGTTDQIKPSGGCTPGNCGGLSLAEGFIANQNAAFNAMVYINGLILGGTSSTTPGTLAFGDNTTPATLQINGDVDTTLAMQSDTLKNPKGDYGVCSNAAGYVVLCDIDVCSNISGLQLAVPAGDVVNANGTCTPAPKEFLSILQNPADYHNFGGGVVNDGDLTMHDPNVNNQGDGYEKNGLYGFYMPYVDGIGLDDGKPPADWLINNVPGVNQTLLAQNQGTLLTAVEAGSYKFTIKYNGQFAGKGKSSHTAVDYGLDFYLKLHTASTGTDQYIPLDNNKAGPPTGNYHENYPVNGDIYPDYSGYNSTNSENYNTYAPFSFDFTKTYNLLPGDQVSLYAYVYGVSAKTGFFATCGDIINDAGCFENFSWDIQAFQGSSIDIVENPSQ